MKESLRPGVSRTNRVTIDKDRTIGFMGEEGRVYATPKLVQDIEHTCRDLILEHGDANEDSVGIDVSIRHLAPTLPGMTVEITARVGGGRQRCRGLSRHAEHRDHGMPERLRPPIFTPNGPPMRRWRSTSPSARRCPGYALSSP